MKRFVCFFLLFLTLFFAISCEKKEDKYISGRYYYENNYLEFDDTGRVTLYTYDTNTYVTVTYKIEDGYFYIKRDNEEHWAAETMTFEKEGNSIWLDGQEMTKKVN